MSNGRWLEGAAMRRLILKALQEKDWNNYEQLALKLETLFYDILPEIVKKCIDTAYGSTKK